MVLWIDWQHDIEAWRGSVESRLEGLEEVTNLIPEILERLGPHTLTSDHQRAVQKYVQQMHELTGKPCGTLYESLKAAFKHKQIEIAVSETDETEYLLRSPGNREHLLKALQDVENNRNIVIPDQQPFQ